LVEQLVEPTVRATSTLIGVELAARRNAVVSFGATLRGRHAPIAWNPQRFSARAHHCPARRPGKRPLSACSPTPERREAAVRASAHSKTTRQETRVRIGGSHRDRQIVSILARKNDIVLAEIPCCQCHARPRGKMRP